MPLPSLADLARVLSVTDIERLLAIKKAGPKLVKLEAKRDKIAGQLAELDKQIAALTGDAPVKAKGKPGRKPGRKRGRIAKAAPAPAKPVAKTKGKPGRKAKAVPNAKPAAKPAPDADAKRAAMLERMAKMRAARWGKKKA